MEFAAILSGTSRGVEQMTKLNKQDKPEARATVTGWLHAFVMFLRKNSYCRFGTHWNVKYDSGMSNDIGRGGVCLDCGYRFEEIKWPRMLWVKNPKCNSCFNAHGGSSGVRSEEHTSELQSHSFISYAVFCLKKKK